MQLFFVIDSVDNLGEKLERVKNVFNCKVFYFVKTALYTKVSTNSEIMSSLSGVYDENVNFKINQFIHNDKYELSDCVIFYSSLDLKNEFLLDFKHKIDYGYDAIYVKEKETFFSKLKDKIYKKAIKLMFNSEDATGSVKIQYLSLNSMKSLRETRFNDRILKASHSSVLYLNEKNPSLNEKSRFDKKTILSLLAGIAMLLIYAIFEILFHLKFYIILMFILLALLAFIISIMLAFNHKLKSRYGDLK